MAMNYGIQLHFMEFSAACRETRRMSCKTVGWPILDVVLFDAKGSIPRQRTVWNCLEVNKEPPGGPCC
jgi:hypothetical protein